MRKIILDINDSTEKLLNRLSGYRVALLVILCIFLDLMSAIIFGFVLFPNVKNPFASFSLIEMLIIGVIIAPIVETYLVQGYVLSKVYTLSGNKKFITILVSALVFGMAHIYPAPPIALKGFFAGLLYATLFFVMQKKKKNPLLFVIIAHALYNLTVICLSQL